VKALYKPFGLVLSVLAGMIASRIFRQVWTLVAGEPDAPDAKDRDRTWGEVLVAAVVQGAIFRVVKTAIDRAAATGFARATGTWPGDAK
jgi:predicted metal-dependent enzyme (double-stranded beta helix superfamily)